MQYGVEHIDDEQPTVGEGKMGQRNGLCTPLLISYTGYIMNHIH